MNELQVFNYKGNNIRTILKDGQPWWVANDVCGILGFSNPNETLKRLDDDEVSSTEVIDSLGRLQNTNIINEPGLYSLILGSRKPEAKQFKRWVTHEVLPSIRQTGQYLLQPQSIEDLIIMQAQSVKEVKEQLALTQAEILAAKEQICEIKEVIISPNEDWRKGVVDKLRKIGFKNGGGTNYKKIGEISYKLLEEKAGCDLNRRLENLRQRMAIQGATKTAIEGACYLDVIANDKRLKEIYINIVNQLYIKYVS